MDTGTLRIIAAVVVLAVILIGAVVLLASTRLRAQVRTWGELASQLGLVLNRKGRPGAPVWLDGEYLGHPVIMDTYMDSRHYKSGGQNRTTVDTFTRIIMEVGNPIGLSLELSKEGAFAKVAQSLGAKDVQTGDAALDKALAIRGEPEDAVIRLLTSEALRQPLLSAPKLDLRLAGGELQYRLPGVEKDAARLRGAFDLLAALATEVARAG